MGSNEEVSQMNGFVEAGYLVIAVTLGGYSAWLIIKGRRIRRTLSSLGERPPKKVAAHPVGEDS